ncbi:MAG: class I SAM-dependent methyltransferase [Candidatus Glassbacteria bacterium]
MISRRESWEKEYGEIRGIHSTYTESEAACFPFFRKVLIEDGFGFNGSLLDVGCGRGRNSYSFLETGMTVVGCDFSRQALLEFRTGAESRGYRDQVSLILCDMENPLPLREGGFDVIMNITSLDNIIERDILKRYASGIVRFLRRGGYHLLYAFLRQDGYYGPLLEEEGYVATDPAAGMSVALYEPEELKELFSPLVTISERTFEFQGPMHGKQYMRKLIAMVMKRE